ncbi:MAG: hypothetical protein ACI4WH_04525 [Oscillospiraceae bacterium]
MIEQKVINKNGKVFTKIKTSKNIKSSFEQFSLSMLLKNHKCIDKWHSRQYRYHLVEGNTLQ